MVVRMRSTKSHRNNRRAHFALVLPPISSCERCGSARRSHELCPHCGSYRGRSVLDLAARVEKKLKKQKEKEKAAR